MDAYEFSWELYKAQTEDFSEDLQFYQNFSKDCVTLDIFSGYGRICNFLSKNNLFISAVEKNKNFASHIALPKDNIYITDILEFQTKKKFERIIAGYNSFCLLTEDNDIFKFFSILKSLLSSNGKISLNYFHPEFWKDSINQEFFFNGMTINYISDYNLNLDRKDMALWIDNYIVGNKKYTYDYKVKVYKDINEINKYLKKFGLKILDVVHNFNNSNTSELGWQDYIIGH
ncbi:hypothetical protein QEJ31_06135 [Pigmentibacter sp. JX0631]|uniref:hypothetical protein n=1 Tax=Pigmentibacter sp. JX0631 TaxID=2976982 RepID=UPI002468DDBE|nr:hypothetical protein [Pigmentibacter sp. JX0631]WGL61174.1 hypothetical protein QEJ31_06135 [Pigmentibacter sp. JX0631]